MPRPFLTGHVIIRKAWENDFPLRECVLSALPICDEFIILCDPDELRTVAECMRLAQEEPKVVALVERWWFPERGQDLLSDATNRCIELVRGEWHLQLQADEVLHQDERQEIRRFCEEGRADWAYLGFRHFWQDFDHIVDDETRLQPAALRVARTRSYPRLRSYNDAMSLGCPDSDPNAFTGADLREQVKLYHYAYTNRPQSRAAHEAEMFQMIIGEVDARTQGDRATYHAIHADALQPFTGTHPDVMKGWLRARS